MSASADVVGVPLRCPECAAPMLLKRSRYGLFYGCSAWPRCTGTHGAHPNGKPLGTPADRATKLARIRAHDAFDQLWRGGGMTRKQAYAWLRRTLGLSKHEAHIGRFDVATCERLIAALAEIPQ